MAVIRVGYYKNAFISLMSLICLLNTMEMGAHAQQRVLLRNKFINGYLVRAGSHDGDRSHVSVTRDITSNRQLNIGGGASHYVGFSISGSVPLDYTRDDATWHLVSRGNGEYEIVHAAFNEPLYAASNGFAYDNDRRKVFTWKKGPSVSQGFWKFEKASNGFYRIKNTAHNEYLYAADYPSKGWIFTFRDPNHPANSDQFYWQLVNA